MLWELFVCMGVSWAGCGSASVAVYPGEDACYRALREMKTGDSPVAESGKKRNTVAYCRPARAEAIKKEKKEGKV